MLKYILYLSEKQIFFQKYIFCGYLQEFPSFMRDCPGYLMQYGTLLILVLREPEWILHHTIYDVQNLMNIASTGSNELYHSIRSDNYLKDVPYMMGMLLIQLMGIHASSTLQSHLLGTCKRSFYLQYRAVVQD